jgi:hypothetical protein
MSGKPMIGPPKTEAGVRTLTIPPNVVPAVVDHLERFVAPEPTAWLFSTSAGAPLSPRNLNRAWDKGRRAAGRPDLHLHDYADIRVMPTFPRNSSSSGVNTLELSA